MLGIKLKNSHKKAVIFVLLVLLLCSVGMVLSYSIYYHDMKEQLEGKSISEDVFYGISSALVEGNYILNNEVFEETDRAYVLQEYSGDQFDLLRKYMDYEVFDWEGNPLLGRNEKSTITKLNRQEDTPYVFRASFTFQEDGELSDIQVSGMKLDERTQYRLEQDLLQIQLSDTQWRSISSPKEVQVVYGMTEESLDEYIGGDGSTNYLSVHELMENSAFCGIVAAFTVITALAAIFISMRLDYSIGEYRLFKVPFEGVLCVFLLLLSLAYYPAKIVWLTIGQGLIPDSSLYNNIISGAVNILMWFIIFAVVFWGVVCLTAIFKMKREYWKQRTLCARGIRWFKSGGNEYGEKVKRGAGGIWSKLKGFCKKQYNGLTHMDFTDKTNKMLIKITAANFVILVGLCTLWFYGILGLIIYSIILFVFMKKLADDIRGKYKLLIHEANQLAKGDLDTPLTYDMGIFNPVQEELKKIQSGFKRAVEEEVKSERMKTELVTNVSHDLKTPLTAIITYIDLLKNERDENKRKEYTEILERKSLRLKVLIEDLFEISKAASKTVTLDFMQVDISGLLKQVELECDSKIKETDLDFRWKLPEQKVVLWLDSQKTYRIFENLIVNITKYAMPHTRVYIEVYDSGQQVTITMKNISASELNFNTDEITDRFVRGDSARNTEGSGLGLAIAKSFTELQHGELKISTEADLFKAEITFRKRGEYAAGGDTPDMAVQEEKMPKSGQTQDDLWDGQPGKENVTVPDKGITDAWDMENRKSSGIDKYVVENHSSQMPYPAALEEPVPSGDGSGGMDSMLNRDSPLKGGSHSSGPETGEDISGKWGYHLVKQEDK